MKILICDDNPIFCDELERGLVQYEINMEIRLLFRRYFREKRH